MSSGRLGHRWDISFEEARNVQQDLAGKVEIQPLPEPITRIAGFDLAYIKQRDLLIAGAVLLEFPSLTIIDTQFFESKITFPYISGYLSFREAPALIELIRSTSLAADIYVFDGQGIAHPRGLGIAAHIGVLLDIPAIGCAKSRLVGQFDPLDAEAGSARPLMLKGQHIGNVLRTKNNVRPVFVSIGHRVNLPGATQLMLDCTAGYRIPEPTRQAHLAVTAYRRRLTESE